MTIMLDDSSFTAHTCAIRARADAMSERRQEIERDVEGLLSTWRGAAADRFAEAWREWRDGADGVISSLASRSQSLMATRDDLCTTDADVGDVGARLRGRLG